MYTLSAGSRFRHWYWQERDLNLSFEATTDLNEGNTRSQWNDFEHYKCKTIVPKGVAAKVVGTWAYTASSYYYTAWEIPSPLFCYKDSAFGPPDNPILGLPVLYDPQPDGSFILPIEGESDLVAHAVRAMLPQVKEELSLLNSIYELKDMKTLPRTVKRMEGLIVQKGYNLKASLRRILQSSSDGYLQQQFNLLPMLSDLTNFRTGLTRVRKTLRKLLSEERKVRTRHYTVTLGPKYCYIADESSTKAYIQVADDSNRFSPKSEYTTTYLSRLHDKVLQTRLVNATGTFHVELKYRFHFMTYQKVYGEFLTFLDTMGVNFNPAIIWNAIPWSFVIDWVAGVNRWLDQFKVQNMEPVVVILDCLWSQKLERTTVIDTVVNADSLKLPRQRHHAVTFVESSYKRTSGYRPVTEALRLSGVSLKEFTLGSALALTRKR